MENSEISKPLSDSVTKDDLKQIVFALVEKAKEGDVQAAKLLFDRLFGKTAMPQKRVSTDDPIARKAKTMQIVAKLTAAKVSEVHVAEN